MSQVSKPATSMSRLRAEGGHFKDENGRVVMLRGFNVGGDSKIPVLGKDPLDVETLLDHRNVSFVGKPFPIDTADQHFDRMKSWGCNCIRLLVPWEAVEHAGPGKYDMAYLEYLEKIVAKAACYGIYVFIDAHQDVWSRFSGGDGAPGWTMEMVGIKLDCIHSTGAGLVHHYAAAEKEKFKKMSWITNNFKFATATMFTLFWGGRTFAPNCLAPNGANIQDFLQECYVKVYVEVAKRLSNFPNVLGFDFMNEPLPGLIGVENLKSFRGPVGLGDHPTIFQAMCLGSGRSCKVLDFSKIQLPLGRRKLNPGRKSLWTGECVWKQHGVWGVSGSQAVLQKPTYFYKVAGKEVDFGEDFFMPLLKKFEVEVRAVMPAAIMFIQSPPEALGMKCCKCPKVSMDNAVFAPHYYDDLTNFWSAYTPWWSIDVPARSLVFGRRRVRRMHFKHVQRLKRTSVEKFQSAPTLIGEVGVPFDLKNDAAYKSGSYHTQVACLNVLLASLERNLLHYTIWCYAANHNKQWKDNWNMEDFSVFSSDQASFSTTNVITGGRAIKAVQRPCAPYIAGTPSCAEFELQDVLFTLSFQQDSSIQSPTTLWVPALHYPGGCDVYMTEGTCWLGEVDTAQQWWTICHEPKDAQHAKHTLYVLPCGARPSFDSKKLSHQQFVIGQPTPAPAPPGADPPAATISGTRDTAKVQDKSQVVQTC